MIKTYIKVKVVDLSEDIISHSLALNVYQNRRTKDGQYVMLTFMENNIPIDIFKLGYPLLTASDAKTELATSAWPTLNETATLKANEITPEHKNGSITTSGTPITITPTSGLIIKKALISNPDSGPNKNDMGDELQVSSDGGVVYVTLARGDAYLFPGDITDLKIDSNQDGTNYEIILWT